MHPAARRPASEHLRVAPALTLRDWCVTAGVNTARGLRLHVRVAAQTSGPSSAAGGRTVATLVVAKEEELRSLLSPGKLAPKAAVVAALRSEIAALRAQLRSAVAADLPPLAPAQPGSRAMSAAPVGGAAMSSARGALLLVEQQMAVSGSGSGGGGVDGVDGAAGSKDRVRNALRMLERRLSMGASLGGAGDDLAELEALQQENVMLQARLDALQAEERQLLWVRQRRASGAAAAGAAPLAARQPAAAADAAPKVRRGRAASSSSSESGSDGEEGATKAAKVTRQRRAVAASDGAEVPKKRGRKPKVQQPAAEAPAEA